jgi:hypothetical protein
VSMTFSRLISVDEIAKKRNINRTTARRWLLALESEYGPGIIVRLTTANRPKLFTTEAALRRCNLAEQEPDWRRVVSELEKKITCIEKRLDDLVLKHPMAALERTIRRPVDAK